MPSAMSAFTMPMMSSARAARSVVSMQEAAAVETPPPPPPLPKIKTMKVGDGTLAGDMNFDPLMISDSPDKLAWFREAEIKHARLAMLAAIGWPVSEMTNIGGLLTNEGRAPSLLNGGLGEVSPIYWAGVVAFAVLAEAKGLDKQFGKKDNYLPGQLGFDLLGMDSDFTRNAEITNGRVAMMAISLYAYEEFLTSAPIFPISLFSPFKKVAEVAAPVLAAANKPVPNADGTYSLRAPEDVATSVLEATQTPPEALMESAAATASVAPMAEMAEAVVTPIAEVVAPIADAAVTAVAPIAEAVAPIAEAVAPIAEAVAPIVSAIAP